eukprot:TRINITY_DN22726_c0_g1_i1.p1 TRINITY_DN22726_c0_g1~~TRINITY_DN22726_c0_g1_i1.p1  ORF type:complete len:256 (+),score=44.16 TRINITY_DN22726_c0_g1_i1:99-866(+)
MADTGRQSALNRLKKAASLGFGPLSAGGPAPSEPRPEPNQRLPSPIKPRPGPRFKSTPDARFLQKQQQETDDYDTSGFLAQPKRRQVAPVSLRSGQAARALPTQISSVSSTAPPVREKPLPPSAFVEQRLEAQQSPAPEANVEAVQRAVGSGKDRAMKAWEADQKWEAPGSSRPKRDEETSAARGEDSVEAASEEEQKRKELLIRKLRKEWRKKRKEEATRGLRRERSRSRDRGGRRSRSRDRARSRSRDRDRHR